MKSFIDSNIFDMFQYIIVIIDTEIVLSEWILMVGFKGQYRTTMNDEKE